MTTSPGELVECRRADWLHRGRVCALKGLPSLDLWRVWRMMRCSGMSFMAACVTSPARSECPEYFFGSSPAAAEEFFTTVATT